MNHISPPYQFFCLLLTLCTLFSGCTNDEPELKTQPTTATSTTAKTEPVTGCAGCHPYQLDSHHDFSCISCHDGDNKTSDKDTAHEVAIAHPSHPDNMEKVCSPCHAKIVKATQNSLHFTLANEINTIRKAFGSTKELSSLIDIPQEAPPSTPLALADDLLRRRCLRCHPYYPGDTYGSVVHGTGCASCHLDYQEGQVSSHRFLTKPGDRQCLSCHYGNYVGADYYGRFEKDLNWEYWTPFSADDESTRPYGVGQHGLRADIHLVKGLNCIDCHPGSTLMAENSAKITCESCHLWDNNKPTSALFANLAYEDNTLTLTTKLTKKKIAVPQLTNPVHFQYSNTVGCQVCHAQWSFADQGIHLIRLDSPDYEPWQALTRQGSSEVEIQLENNLFQDDESDPVMTDKISGQLKAGIWLKGYELRRWEEIATCTDNTNRLQVCRTPHVLHLSFVNTDDEVVFDSVTGSTPEPEMLPYVPHTTGKAGPFFYDRIQKINSTNNNLP